MNNIDDFLALLKNVKVRGKDQWQSDCPCLDHKTVQKHLSIAIKDSAILVKCFGPHSSEDIVRALNLTLSDLFISQDNLPTNIAKKIVAEYSYQDENGLELFQVVRFVPKRFAQRHRNGSGEWAWNLDGVRRVLYHLPEVIKTSALYLVEGERDTDNLRALGLVATTSPGGAQNWRPEYAAFLAGKNITLIPDMDGHGLDYARDIARDLEGKAQLSVILLPKPAKDISDWLAAGGDVKALPGMAQGIGALFAIKSEDVGPEIIARGRVYTYTWASEHIVITVDRIAEERHIISSEVEVSRGNVERHSRLGRARINLLSTQGRGSLVKYLSTREPGLAHAWDGMVQTACDETVDRFRQGDEAVELWTPETIPPQQEYLLWPLLPLGQPTLMFGEGESGKSYLALFCYVAARTGWLNNPMGLKVGEGESAIINALYLDWETTEAEIMSRMWRIKEGAPKRGILPITYRNCRRPLAGDIDAIQRMIIQHQADFLIVDSGAPACGGDINAPQPVEEFFGALRELKGYIYEHVTTLILGHTSKDQLTKRKTPFGSVFWFNYARAVWEAKRSEAHGDILKVTLACRKANNSRRPDPLGFELTWTGEGVTIGRVEVIDSPDNPDDVGAELSILQALNAAGACTTARLVTLVGKPDNAIRVYLGRLADKGLVSQAGREGKAIIWKAFVPGADNADA